MNDALSDKLGQIRIDTHNLYQETTFTDLKVGSFRRPPRSFSSRPT